MGELTNGMDKLAEQVLTAGLDGGAIHAYRSPDVRRLAALLSDETARRALLDALDAVSRDHQRAEYHVRMAYLTERDEAENRAERAERERGALRSRFERLANDAANWPFGKDGHLWQMHEKRDFARWLRARAALSADADADAEPERCPRCRVAISGWKRWSSVRDGVCEDCDEPEPSRAEGDEGPDCTCNSREVDGRTGEQVHTIDCDITYAEGGRPREADPQGPSIGSDASVDAEGDDGRSRAMHAMWEGTAQRRGVSWDTLQLLLADALDSGGVVDVMAHKRALEAEAAKTDEWKARVRELEAALSDVLSRFTHEGHPGRPCLSTGWEPVEHVREWRAALDGGRS